MKILLLHELIFSVSISFYVKGGPGAVVETLHLWPASLQYFKFFFAMVRLSRNSIPQIPPYVEAFSTGHALLLSAFM